MARSKRMITDYIKVYDNAIPSDFCDELVSRFEQVLTTDPGPDIWEVNHTSNPVRSCLEMNLSQSKCMDDLHPQFQKIIEVVTAQYQKNLEGKFVFPQVLGCEQYRMNKYRSKDSLNKLNPMYYADALDQFGYHVAVNDYESARRFVSFIWFLNDVPAGGEFYMPQFQLKVPPVKGRCVVFPATWMFPWQEEAPLTDKYTMSTFLHYCN